MGEKGECYLGVLLTAKTQRKFCEIAKLKEGLKVTVKDLKDRSRLVEFNFFVIHKKTARGIFQHYKGSCGLKAFESFLRRSYNEIRDSRKNAELSQAGGVAAPKARRAEIIAKYKPTLECVAMFKRKDLAELINQMTQIRSISFDAMTVNAVAPWFTPIADTLKRERHTFSFKPDALVSRIAQPIIDMFHKVVPANHGGIDEEADNISVVGLDPTGEAVTYRAFRNLESLAQYDFDEIADESFLDLQEIHNSPFFDKLLEAMSQNVELFERKISK